MLYEVFLWECVSNSNGWFGRKVLNISRVG